MDFITWIDEERGRAAMVAAHFKISRAAVSFWKTNGVPRAHMKELRALSQEKVTLEEMVPDSAASKGRQALTA